MQRRCVHDEHGRVDPAKVAEPSKPRGSTSGKRPARVSDEHQSKRVKSESSMDHYPVFTHQPDIDAMIDPALMGPVDPMAGLHFPDPSMPITDVNAISTPPQHLSVQNGSGIPNGLVQPAIDPNLDPALIDEDAIDPMLDQAVSLDHEQHGLLSSILPQLRTAIVGTPDVDKSFSPITTESAEVRSKHDSEEEQSHPVHSATEQSAPEPEVLHSQVNGVIHAAPTPTSEVKQEPEIEHQGLSSATSTSPKPEAISSSDPKPSSHVSGTTHQAIEEPVVVAETVAVNRSPKQVISPQAKKEATTSTWDVIRTDPVDGNSSEPEDQSEKLARELQAQEHGLRRRPSVRIS